MLLDLGGDLADPFGPHLFRHRHQAKTVRAIATEKPAGGRHGIGGHKVDEPSRWISSTGPSATISNADTINGDVRGIPSRVAVAFASPRPSRSERGRSPLMPRSISRDERAWIMCSAATRAASTRACSAERRAPSHLRSPRWSRASASLRLWEPRSGGVHRGR